MGKENSKIALTDRFKNADPKERDKIIREVIIMMLKDQQRINSSKE